MTTDQLKENYVFTPQSGKWLPKGADLLKLKGQEILRISYYQDEITSEWVTEPETIILEQVNEYFPDVTCYEVVLKAPAPDLKEEVARITPDGFVYEDPEKKIWRLCPISLYSKQREEHLFTKTLGNLYEKEALSFDQMKTFSGLSTIPELLGYIFHGTAILKFPNSEYGYFRISEINLSKVDGEDYVLAMKDQEGRSFTLQIKEGDEEYVMTNEVMMKIVTLG